MLFEGDGGFLFHIQELETLKRQGYRILMCVMNDGGYGSEFHKLRADGVDDRWALFGRPRSKTLHAVSACAATRYAMYRYPKLFADFAAQGESENLEYPNFRPGHGTGDPPDIKRGHGNM